MQMSSIYRDRFLQWHFQKGIRTNVPGFDWHFCRKKQSFALVILKFMLGRQEQEKIEKKVVKQSVTAECQRHVLCFKIQDKNRNQI